MIDWSMQVLSEASGLGIATVRQFEAGEVMRQVTGYTIRNTYSPPIERVYPA